MTDGVINMAAEKINGVNNTDNLTVTVVINANNGVPNVVTTAGLRRVRGIDGATVVTVGNMFQTGIAAMRAAKMIEPGRTPIVQWAAHRNIRSMDELPANDNSVFLAINGGDVVDPSFMEHVRAFYGNHNVAEPIPDDIREKFITKGALTAGDIRGGHKYVISCIVPFRDLGESAWEAVDVLTGSSAYSQEYVQYVFVDYGSADGGAEYIKEYAEMFPEDNITVISQKRKGLNAARNAGLNAAEGRYAAFWDLSEEMYPNYFESALEAFNADKDIGFVTLPISYINDVYGEENVKNGLKYYKRVIIDNDKTPGKVQMNVDRMVISRDAIESAESDGLRFDEMVNTDEGAEKEFIRKLLENNSRYGASSTDWYIS